MSAPVQQSSLRVTRPALILVATAGAACLLLSACGSGASAGSATSSTPVASSASAAAATTAPASGSPATDASVQQAIPYATTSASQTLDLYLPATDGSTPVPVVVLIHGGAFKMGDSSMEAGYAQQLVDAGFAVAAVNYRLSGEAAYPAGAQDVKAAVRWIRANAAQYGLDPDNIGAWGQSAGGWMASMLGATGDQATIFDDPSLGNADQSSAVQAVVSWFGPTDFGTMDAQAAEVTACAGKAQVHGTADSPESVWLGEAVDSSDLTASTNLSSYLAGATTLPSWYLAHGDSDCLVPGGQSAQLADALTARGADPTYVVLEGAGHMEPAFDSTQLTPTIDFLRTSLGAA